MSPTWMIDCCDGKTNVLREKGSRHDEDDCRDEEVKGSLIFNKFLDLHWFFFPLFFPYRNPLDVTYKFYANVAMAKLLLCYWSKILPRGNYQIMIWNGNQEKFKEVFFVDKKNMEISRSEDDFKVKHFDFFTFFGLNFLIFQACSKLP